jgi:hypothetical protein
MPTPCTIPIGKKIAPAIRKPHLPIDRHTITWVSHAATAAKPREIPVKLLIYYSSKTEVYTQPFGI